MIVLSFTNKDATGVQAVIDKLKGNSTIRNSDVVIAVVYWDNGQPAVQCISAGCANMKRDNPVGYEQLMQKLKDAFNGAISAYPGLSPAAAWHIAFAACGGDVDCILFIAEQIAKEGD